MDAEIRQRLKETGRNDPCPCGSGQKYKRCHQEADAAARREADRLLAEAQLQAVDEVETPDEEQPEDGRKKKTPPARFQGKRRSEKIHSGNRGGRQEKKANLLPRRSNG